MATRTHPGLYTFGAVELDSSPSVNLFAQLMARKRAKQEALDEYDRNRINNINPTGVRDVDRQGFDKRVDDLKRFYITNKDKITKGNTPESLQYEKTFRDISAYINQSKERTAKQDAAMKLYQDVLKKDGIIPDDDEGGGSFLDDLDLNDKGIDENSKSFDLPKWMSVSQKPFNPQAQLKKYSDIKRTPGTPKYERIEGQSLKLNEVIEEKFDTPSKKVIAERAATDYHSSLGFKRTVDSEYGNPVSRSELAKTFQQEYGIPPAQMEDYATAYQLSIMQPTITKSKAVDDRNAIMNKQFGQRLKYAAVQDSYIRGRAKLNETPGLSKYDVLSLYDGKATPLKRTISVPGANGTIETVEKTDYIIPANEVDANHKKLFGEVSPYTKEDGTKYYILREDGDWEGRNGQVISRVSVATEKQGKTTLSEEKRGVPDMNSDRRPPKEIPKTKIAPKKYKGLDKNGNPIFE